MTAVHAVWLLLAAYLAAATGFLLLSRKKSLRLGSLLIAALVSLAFRGLGWLIWPTGDVWDGGGLAVVGLLVVIALVGRQAWLVRTTLEQLIEELAEACRSVRIQCEQRSSNELTLLLKEGTQMIRIRTLVPGVQLLILPKTINAKVVLLVNLLRKRYPPWWPRFSISLSRSKE